MIIDVRDIMSVRSIAQNIDSDTRIAPYIIEVETLYVIPALGAQLYKEINDDCCKHEVLLQGGFYNNDTKYFAGLIHAVAYLVYSRFVLSHNINVTSFGIVVKTGEYSTPVSSSTLLTISRESEKIGQEYLRQCIDYLKFQKRICEDVEHKHKVKFKAIG